jgi:hypothetical protein
MDSALKVILKQLRELKDMSAGQDQLAADHDEPKS